MCVCSYNAYLNVPLGHLFYKENNIKKANQYFMWGFK